MAAAGFWRRSRHDAELGVLAGDGSHRRHSRLDMYSWTPGPLDFVGDILVASPSTRSHGERVHLIEVEAQRDHNLVAAETEANGCGQHSVVDELRNLATSHRSQVQQRISNRFQGGPAALYCALLAADHHQQL